MSAPPPRPHDPKIERILLKIVPEKWRKFIAGLSAGLVGEEDGFSEGKQAGFEEGVESRLDIPGGSDDAVLDERALEAERVWGFDVGWKLCSELQQSRASQVSLVLPSSSSPHSRSAGLYTNGRRRRRDRCPRRRQRRPCTIGLGRGRSSPSDISLTFRIAAVDSTRFLSPSYGLSAAVRKFAAAPSTLSTTCGFLLARNSLDANAIHSPTPEKPTIRAAPRRTPPSCSHPPPSITFRAPTSFPPSDRPAPQFPLDWDQDPRLRDLGQALAALGWARL
ncbi:hypothetical protein DFH09DRAFT_1407479 [Mycena vulgaris]|nr:hypothetical protein DFH09DRAFT_1407479 [Mycena vulgaris]